MRPSRSRRPRRRPRPGWRNPRQTGSRPRLPAWVQCRTAGWSTGGGRKGLEAEGRRMGSQLELTSIQGWRSTLLDPGGERAKDGDTPARGIIVLLLLVVPAWSRTGSGLSCVGVCWGMRSSVDALATHVWARSFSSSHRPPPLLPLQRQPCCEYTTPRSDACDCIGCGLLTFCSLASFSIPDNVPPPS